MCCRLGETLPLLVHSLGPGSGRFRFGCLLVGAMSSQPQSVFASPSGSLLPISVSLLNMVLKHKLVIVGDGGVGTLPTDANFALTSSPGPNCRPRPSFPWS